MSLVAFLATRIRIPPWVVEILLGALPVLGIWLSGVFHEKARVEVRTVKQEVQVEKRIVETDHSHDQELADLRAYRDSHPLQPVRLCKPASLPAPAEGRPSPATADIQPVPGGDPEIRSAGDPPDIAPLLGLLAFQGDRVSAGLRRRQKLEP